MDREIIKILLSKSDRYLKIWFSIFTQVNDDSKLHTTLTKLASQFNCQITQIIRVLELQKQWNKERQVTKIHMRKNNAWVTTMTKFPIETKSDKLLNLPTTAKITRDSIVIEIVDYKQQLITELPMVEPEQLSLNLLGEEPTSEPIKVIYINSEIKEPKQIKPPKEESPKALAKIEFIKIRKSAITIYHDFYKERHGVEPIINGTQIKAIDEILKYFKKINTDKSYEQVTASFGIIFKNWNIYPVYIQEQFKVTQILSNLPNIIAYLKNNGSKKDMTKSDQLRNFKNTMDTEIEKGTMDEAIERLGER